MTKALHDFVKRAWLAIVSTQHAQYRFMVSHKSIFFVSDVSVFYDFLCFFLFVCFFQVLDEMIDLFIVLYHVMKHGNLMCGWCVWTVALNVLGLFFFFLFLPKLPSSEKSQNERTLVWASHRYSCCENRFFSKPKH